MVAVDFYYRTVDEAEGVALFETECSVDLKPSRQVETKV
jgi:hypothetical protein